MKQLFTVLLLTVTLIATAALNSNTYIEPKQSFLLGNNPHGAFKVKLKNTCNHDLQVVLNPINGGSHSPQTVRAGEKISLSVDKNTALCIINNTNEKGSVALKVTGDLGLSMGYTR